MWKNKCAISFVDNKKNDEIFYGMGDVTRDFLKNGVQFRSILAIIWRLLTTQV